MWEITFAVLLIGTLVFIAVCQIAVSLTFKREYLKGLGKVDMDAPKTWYERFTKRMI